jgi:kojibiose phosphorylase
MKDHYSKYTEEYSWMIKEEGWVKSLQGIRESQLALGNGFLGSRAVLEEIPYNAKPGTYIAGLYDKVGSQVAELINLPNPFNFRIAIGGEKLGVGTMDVLEHKRTLNLKHGLLLRHTILRDSKKRKYDFQTLRFLSMHDKNVGVMQVVFTPLEGAVKASIETGIDTAVYNTGTVTEGRKKHFRVKELGQFRNEGYLILETFDKLHKVIFRSGFYYETLGKKVVAKDNVFELNLRKNQTIVFTKIFYADTVSPEDDFDKMKELSEKKFRKSFQSNFKSLLKNHIRSWKDLWGVSEVSIWSAPEVEKNFRFNIYHMLITAPRDKGLSSIGAKGLTGEGYHGHIFWDTEIFLLPFYIYTLPDIAKNILLYRYKRLDTARAIARRAGYRGAMFPWESAGIGEDETPNWAKDLDGSIIKIHTGKREHHITADIAYAFYHYYNATMDEKFLRDFGYEVIFETARFWASRAEHNKKKKKYEIKHIIGPDEFHEDVNNNAYTNAMAKWNLLTAYKMFSGIKKREPKTLKDVTKKIALMPKEPAEWKRIASRIFINMDKKQIIEQFEGYFRKKKVKISNWDENFIPVVTGKISTKKYAKTQLVKQADVVLLMHLLSDTFSSKTKKQNYQYYVDRTMHRSSLSLPAYAVVAIDVEDKNRAFRFFNAALHADLSNIHDNTDEGIHAACIGGTWQVLIHGFAGVRIEKEILSINPRLPKIWRKLLFSLHWRGILLRLETKNNEVKIQAIQLNKKKKAKIRVFGVLHEITAGKVFTFKRKISGEKKEAHYL